MITALPNTIVLIPVFNEEANLLPLLKEVGAHLPGVPVCFINDCSTDGTAQKLKTAGCAHLNLPCNLGVGGAMQAGFRYACEQGYAYAIRLDGDGQHPPSECGALIDRMAQGDVDMVAGSRFLAEGGYTSTMARQIGIAGLAAFLSYACRQKITDPTSGFQMVNRAVMLYFAHQYPADYPEPESLALLSRQGYRFAEVAAKFRERQAGQSSIRRWGTIFYMVKVCIALFVDRCRAVDPRFDRRNMEAAP
ncbi:MAG TPA: glycosyl transferase family 2 [Verrucomicrobia bacterium]|nr:glycosyl transferase family 2 [Verrucomicrobiota bacterium]